MLASIAGFFIAPYTVQHLIVGESGLTGLVFLSPAEAFFSRVKLALAIGVLIGLPFILYQGWALVAPAFDRAQKRLSLVLLPVAYFLFLGGVLFAYAGVLPFALRFFLSFGGETLQQEISIGNYVSFIISFLLPFGIIFQMPVVITLLTRLGILRPDSMAKNRKYVVFGAFIVATLLTPADLFSQFMMAIPLIILFEISLIVGRAVAPKVQSEAKEERPAQT